MCCNITECITVWDIFSFIFGIILSAVMTIVLIKLFRPNILILEPEFEQIDKKIILKIPVKNESRFSAVSNLRIEAAAVLNDKTYHIDFDRKDFLILSRNKKCGKETPFVRTFHGIDVNYYTKSIADECKNMNDFLNLLEQNDACLRVRVHANHEFTGFGKVFETRFLFKQFSRFKLKC